MIEHLMNGIEIKPIIGDSPLHSKKVDGEVTNYQNHVSVVC